MSAVAIVATDPPVSRDVERYADTVPERAHVEVVTHLGLDEPTLVLTDAWGEVYGSWRGAPSSWPDREDLAEWIDYIAIQCPECGPLEDRWREEAR